MPTHTPETLELTDTIFSDFGAHIAPITINQVMMERFMTLFGTDKRQDKRRRMFTGSETFETRALMSGIPAEIRGVDAAGNNVNIETDEQLLTRATAIALEGTDAQKSDFIIGLATMSMQKQEALLLGLEEALTTKDSSLKSASDTLAALPAPGALPWASDTMQWGASGNADLAGKIAKTGDYVRSVAISPNQSTVAVADGKNIRMIDAATGGSLWSTNAHHDRLTIQAAFSTDGTKLVTHGHDKGVTMLNAATGDVIWQMPIGQYIDNVTWSQDQTKVLVSDYWGRISTMDAATGELTVLASDPKIWHAEYAPDGSILVANAQKLERRNAQMQNVSQSFQAPFTLHESATQPNGNLVAGTSMSDGKIVFWDKTSGNQVALVDTGDIRVWKAEFSPNGKILAAVTNSSGVMVYSVNGTTITKLKQLTNMGEITDAAFSADGSALTISTQTGLYLYKTSDAARTPIVAPESQERANLRAEVAELTRQKTALQNLTTSVDDLLDLERATFTLPMGPFVPSDTDAEPLSEELLDQTVLAFLEDQRQESESIQSRTWEQLTFAQAGILSMALSPESDRIAVARADGSVRFLIAATGEETGTPLSLGQVTHMTYGRDGMLFLASGSTVSVVDETGVVVKSVVTPGVIAGIQTLRDGSIVIVSGADGSSTTCVTCVGTDGTETWRKDLPNTAMGISVTSDGRSITYSQPNGIITEALRPGGESFQKSFSGEFGSASVYASTSVVTPYGGRMIYGLNAGGSAVIHITDMRGQTVVRSHNFGRDQTITSVRSVGGNFFLVDIMCQYPHPHRDTKLMELKMDVLEERQSSTLQSWRTAPMSVSEDGKTVLTGGMDTVKAVTLPHVVSDTEALLLGASRIGNAVITNGRLDNPEGKQLMNAQRADLLMMAEKQGDAFNFRYSDERVWQKFMAVNDGWHEENRAAAMKANNWSSDYFFYARGQEYESFRTKIGAYEDAAGRMMEAGMNAVLNDVKGLDPTQAITELRKIESEKTGDHNFKKLSHIGICVPTEATVLEACRKILINCVEEYVDMQRVYEARTESAIRRVDHPTVSQEGASATPPANISEQRASFLARLKAAQAALPMYGTDGATIIGYGGTIGKSSPEDQQAKNAEEQMIDNVLNGNVPSTSAEAGKLLHTLKIHAGRDVLSAMSSVTLTRLENIAKKGLESAAAREALAEIAHWTRLLEAAQGLLSIIPSGKAVPDMSLDPKAPEWKAYVEKTTTDPIPTGQEGSTLNIGSASRNGQNVNPVLVAQSNDIVYPPVSGINLTGYNVTVTPKGERKIIFSLDGESMVNLWTPGIWNRNLVLRLGGTTLTETFVSKKSGFNGGESVSARLPKGTYTFTITDMTDYTKVLNGATLKQENFPAQANIKVTPYNSANIEGRISIDGSEKVMPVSLRVAEFNGNDRITNYDTVGLKNSLDSSKPVWVVVHGRENSEDSSQILELTNNLQSLGAQVVTLDWEDGAKDNLTPLVGLEGSKWIESVGAWGANQLRAAGFTSDKINTIGHSWGSYVAYEIGAHIPGGVKTLVALDPAADTRAIGGGKYKGFSDPNFSFANVSGNSYGFHSSFYGDGEKAKTAEYSFDILVPEGYEFGNTSTSPLERAKDVYVHGGAVSELRDEVIDDPGREHGFAVSLFSNLLQRQAKSPNDPTAQFFALAKLQTDLKCFGQKGYEGVFTVDPTLGFNEVGSEAGKKSWQARVFGFYGKDEDGNDILFPRNL